MLTPSPSRTETEVTWKLLELHLEAVMPKRKVANVKKSKAG